MTQAFEPISALEQLLRALVRSLPAYLADARPWGQAGHPAIQAALDRLVADQHMYAGRLAEAISQRGGCPDPGGFPIHFTAKHDLALDFLLQEVVEEQQQALTQIVDAAARLEDVAVLHALAEEIVGNARGHLDNLREAARAQP